MTRYMQRNNVNEIPPLSKIQASQTIPNPPAPARSITTLSNPYQTPPTTKRDAKWMKKDRDIKESMILEALPIYVTIASQFENTKTLKIKKSKTPTSASKRKKKSRNRGNPLGYSIFNTCLLGTSPEELIDEIHKNGNKPDFAQVSKGSGRRITTYDRIYWWGYQWIMRIEAEDPDLKGIWDEWTKQRADIFDKYPKRLGKTKSNLGGFAVCISIYI